MNNCKKYQKQFFMPPNPSFEFLKKTSIDSAPLWCSVDLRDGNQALPEPMNIDERLEFFKMLCSIGFKEIEIGSPASSDLEYSFIRKLIVEKLIPDDVKIQVITQARERKIRKTFEAIRGAENVTVHLYNSISPIHRRQVFDASKQDIKLIAVEGATHIKKLAEKFGINCTFEYSPESFSETEPEFALEICNAVLDVWQPTESNKAIINLTSTVEIALPHVFASQVNYISNNLKYRNAVILGVHNHNDRGCAVSTAELSLLAGAQRIEGTLFGNGDRTGNTDIITLALNMYSQGIDPYLDFSDIPKIAEIYERCTGMSVYERTPYTGELVFSEFSAAQQDAVAKSFKFREKYQQAHWNVPYIPIDPKDIGRAYDSDIIRINGQSGKGGVSYILNKKFGIKIPNKMKNEFSQTIKGLSDSEHKELKPETIYKIFIGTYVNNTSVFTSPKQTFTRDGKMKAEVVISLYSGDTLTVKSEGNGRLDAVRNALQKYFDTEFDIDVYEEHALSTGSASKAISYVCITSGKESHWGVGVDEDIIKSSINALVVAVNRLRSVREFQFNTDTRMFEMLEYIRENFQTVTLDSLSSNFFLSKQYVSKYIKEKSGMTFCDNVQKFRMKKAEELLSTTTLTVENVAELSGYPSVEHFNRRFKKAHGLTPVQYRNQNKK